MEETKIVLTETAYGNYLSSYLKLEILRELLSKTKSYEWETIIRGVLDIPVKEDQE